MFGRIFDSVCNTVEDFIDDPIGATVNHALSPVHHTLDILEGLSEGEIRTLAALKLGTDVVAGMAIGEIIELLAEEL